MSKLITIIIVLYVRFIFFIRLLFLSIFLFLSFLLFFYNCIVIVSDVLNNSLVYTRIFLVFRRLLSILFIVQRVLISVLNNTILYINLEIFFICILINLYK